MEADEGMSDVSDTNNLPLTPLVLGALMDRADRYLGAARLNLAMGDLYDAEKMVLDAADLIGEIICALEDEADEADEGDEADDK